MHGPTCIFWANLTPVSLQGAAVVICFMSRKYQLSENCKLELKFARQTGVPIVPVMIRAANPRGPTGPPWHPVEDPLGSSPDTESAIGNAAALVPGPLARL